MEKLICPDCGNIIDRDLDICDNCGCPKKYFKRNIVNLKCPECGEMTLSSEDCCPSCGCPMEIIVAANSVTKELSVKDKKRMAMEKRKRRKNVLIDDRDDLKDIEDLEKEKLKKLANGELQLSRKEEQPSSKKEAIVLKVAGVTFENRQVTIEKLIKNNIIYVGARLLLKTEHCNAYDSFAVQVFSINGERIGYLPKGSNKQIFNKIENGTKFDVTVIGIGGGSSNYNYGITIEIKEK